MRLLHFKSTQMLWKIDRLLHFKSTQILRKNRSKLHRDFKKNRSKLHKTEKSIKDTYQINFDMLDSEKSHVSVAFSGLFQV